MRPLGSPEALAQRRRRAITLYQEGYTAVEVARQIGVDRRNVRRWKAAYRKHGEAGIQARRAPGRPAALDGKAKKRLEKILLQGGHGQELFRRGLFPFRQGVMQLHDVFQDTRLGDRLSDQCLDRVLHPFQGEHLGDQQVQGIGFDAGHLLQRAGHVFWETPFGARLAMGGTA